MADKSKKKGSKKGGKKVDPFSRKEWYNVRAPTVFFQPNESNQIGYTPVNRTQGTKLASDGLKGRVFDVCLGDMKNDENHVFRKIKLRADEVEGKSVLTNFHGMDMTSDKLRSLIHKWATLIECFVDVKTTDGYTLRVFAITFTKKASEKQAKKTSYAKSSKVKLIRKKMFEIINAEITATDLASVVKKFVDQTISEKIQKQCSQYFPLNNTYIRKVKVLKQPKFEIAKLLEHYQNAPVAAAPAPVEETGVAVERTEETATA
ncbi:hypothetical protein SAMD00019534_061200 [Acytostelium subglobosum LB1]|uniref:hypothetical protein n=1 Tax=Acytostelium subglobosum LB1 TaxID=1410327 RepID=UPI000644814C|nr:hypothetical protein SAMD00019534_061200 [Acytostelium subglobosum LB1]GAM22945.1 hypothetical protein SAMD00019534_061200 [Acytostelium subglobosum LB1]|eukprot:XP_012754172.1 hypothetical protein SAMD00019534_061200 [Acytostelium subglobosum LB1]